MHPTTTKPGSTTETGAVLDGLLEVLAPDVWGDFDAGPDGPTAVVIRGADRVARNLGTPAVVRPSRLVTVMRPLVKLLNPVMIKLAGRRHMRMAAQIRHVGRRSGRAYVTPPARGSPATRSSSR